MATRILHSYYNIVGLKGSERGMQRGQHNVAIPGKEESVMS